MTDREPTIPADRTRPSSIRPQIKLLVGELCLNPHLDSAPRGDCSPMSVTLAPRPPSRPSTTDDSPADPLRAFLAQLAASSPTLSSFPNTLLPATNYRNPVEAYAAARAAGCPDLFVIHAPDAAARERVIVDLILAAGTERLLVLSPDALTADRIVERALKMDVSVARALADDENPTRPSPIVAKATSAALLAARLERLKRNAAGAVSEAADRKAAIDNALAALAQLVELTQRQLTIDAQIADANARRERIEGQVQREALGAEATAFTAILEQRKSESQTTVDLIQQKQLAAQAAHKEKESLVASLQKQAGEASSEAAKKSGFLSRLLHRPKPCVSTADLEKQLHEAERELSEAAAAISAFQLDLDAISATLLAEREQLIETEIALRQTELAAQLARFAEESTRLQSEVDRVKKALGPTPPSESELLATRATLESELTAARLRASEVDRTAAEQAKRVLAEVKVVVGTPGSLAADPVFDRDPHTAGSSRSFELLVLDRAEDLTEPDFTHLAKLARRWVLIGNAATTDDPRAKAPSARNGSSHGRNGRPVEIPFAARLVQLLDRERWALEPDRLVCRLEHLTPDSRRRLSREPLLDRPEIELRITTHQGSEPVLAEIAFPSTQSLASAKSFLYHQLGAILLRPCGEATWQSTETAIAATWAAVDRMSTPTDCTWIDLEPGVREKVVGHGLAAFTAAVTFDLAAGWDEEKSRIWINEHVSMESSSRFATIPRSARG